MSAVPSTLAMFCLSVGAFFVVVGCIGLVRMPDLYTRMHAASVTDTLGAGLLLLGMMLHAGPTLVSAKLLILGLLIFFASPAATHALARAALARGVPLIATTPGQPASKP
jgi:multicomponent Na+:H+ antiporter subunit G